MHAPGWPPGPRPRERCGRRASGLTGSLTVKRASPLPTPPWPAGDGLAVRLLLPAADSVRFVTAYRRLPAPYRYAVYRPNGLLRVADSPTLDSVLASHAPAPR